MIRVLHINRSMNRGGIETFIMNAYRMLDQSQVQFDFLLNNDNNDYRSEIESLGGRIYIIPPRNQGFIKYRQNLNAFFSRYAHNFNAIHMHDSSLTSIEPLLYARKYGVKIRIIHAHSTNQPGVLHQFLHYIHKPFIHRLATHYYACSDKAKSWMYDYTKVISKAVIVKNGIIAADFKYNQNVRYKVRKLLNISEDEIVLGLVANLVVVKNHQFLIEVFREFKKINQQSRLILIGGGNLVENVQEQIRINGLTESVLYLGKRTDIAALLQAMDAFVMPSLWEGLPVSLVEAQAAGLPVFCSDTISPMSKITQNYHSLSLSKNATKWAQVIKAKLETYHRKDESNEIVLAGFDIATSIQNLMNVYCS